MPIPTVACLASTALLATAAPAAADPPVATGHNCAGAFASTVVAGSRGIPSQVAQGGPRAVSAAVLPDANCGANP